MRALRVDGHSPEQIARALGLRPAAVAEIARTIAGERAAAAGRRGVLGESWLVRRQRLAVRLPSVSVGVVPAGSAG